jgi:hypothetical protein
VKLLVINGHVWLLKTNTQEDAFIALLSKLLKSEVFAEFLAIMYLDSELLHHFYLPLSFRERSSVLRNFSSHDTTSNLILLEDMNVFIAHTSEECCAAE